MSDEKEVRCQFCGQILATGDEWGGHTYPTDEPASQDPEGFIPGPVFVGPDNTKVVMLTCITCGCCVIYDPRDGNKLLDLHRQWHVQAVWM